VPARRRWLAAGAVSAGLFLAVLSTTMVSVALLSLGRALHTGPTGREWAVDAYVVVYASLLVPAGVLGDRWGRKGAFLSGVGLFGAGALVAGLATGTPMLLAGRVVQGIGPALLIPGSLTIIRATFDDERQRSVAIGAWSTSSGLGMAIGPVLGGLIVAGLGWRWVFLINVPLAAVVAALVAVVVPRLPRNPGAARFDWPGAMLSVAGVALLAFGVIEGQSRGWSAPLVVGSLVTGAFALAGFVAVETGTARPLIDMALFARRRFVAAIVAALIVFFAFVGAIVYFSAFFQQVQGRTAIGAGLAVAPLGIAYAIAATVSGRLVGRYGERWPLVIGLLVSGIATLLLLRLRADTGIGAIWWNFALLGAGVGLSGTPMSTLAMSAADIARAGMASAVLNAARQVGQVFGVAVLGALIYARVDYVAGLHDALVLSGVLLVGTAALVAPLLRERRA
jgi:MFS transporter, DHA2 family, methylenomycin A resistance protein